MEGVLRIARNQAEGNESGIRDTGSGEIKRVPREGQMPSQVEMIYQTLCVLPGICRKKKVATQLHFLLTAHNLFPLEGKKESERGRV